MHGKLNEQLFLKQVVIQQPQLKTARTYIFTYLYILYYKTKQKAKWDSYSGDHIAR